MQFGKLDLAKALKKDRIAVENNERNVKETVVEQTKADEKSSQSDSILTGTVPPLYFMSYSLDTVKVFNMGEIRLPKDMPDKFHPDRCDICLRAEKYDDGIADGAKIWIESTTITPQYIKGKPLMNFLCSTAFTPIQFEFTKGAPAGEFKGEVVVKANGFSNSVILPIKGTIVYE